MSADVDAAREALQAAIVTNATARQVIEAIDAFEAAIRAEAGRLDAERLEEALVEGLNTVDNEWTTAEMAEAVAAEYARQDPS